MTCYYPKNIYEDKQKTKPVRIPCGDCIGCRLEYARQWAVRMSHEASLYKENCFITLTYRNKDLPKGGSLCKRDMQLFMKRLRKKNEGKEIRFYGCGEYGPRFSRPHYHIILFNHDFSDKILYKSGQARTGRNDVHDHRRFSIYTSKELEKTWKKGFTSIGEVTFESAGYVARYCTKKITGKNKEKHYRDKEPEFALMSRMPGIGYEWLKKYRSDIYPKDYFHLDGKKMRPVKYYDRKLMRELSDKGRYEEYEKIKERRKAKAIDHPATERYRKWHHKRLTTKKLIRSYENA